MRGPLSALLVAAITTALGSGGETAPLCAVIHANVPLRVPPIAEGVGPEPTTAISEIAAAKDGSLWGIEGNASRIVHITPTGSVKEFPLKTAALLVHITVGSGSVYFVELVGDFASENRGRDLPMLGELSSSGTIRLHRLPHSVGSLDQIVAGHKDDVWFVSGLQIGRWTEGSLRVRTVAKNGSVTIYGVDNADRALFSVRNKATLTQNGAVDSRGEVSTRNPKMIVKLALAPDGSTILIKKDVQGLAVCGAEVSNLDFETSWCTASNHRIDQLSAIDSTHAAVVFTTAGRSLALTQPFISKLLYEAPDYIGFLVSAPDGRVWFSYASGQDPNHFVSGVLCSSKVAQ